MEASFSACSHLCFWPTLNINIIVIKVVLFTHLHIKFLEVLLFHFVTILMNFECAVAFNIGLGHKFQIQICILFMLNYIMVNLDGTLAGIVIIIFIGTLNQPSQLLLILL